MVVAVLVWAPTGEVGAQLTVRGESQDNGNEAIDRTRRCVIIDKMERVDVKLLGQFEVRVDGEPVSADAWKHGRAKDLVKLLALAAGHRLPGLRRVPGVAPGQARREPTACHRPAGLGFRGGAIGDPRAERSLLLSRPHRVVRGDPRLLALGRMAASQCRGLTLEPGTFRLRRLHGRSSRVLCSLVGT